MHDVLVNKVNVLPVHRMRLVGETALGCWCWLLMTASTWQGMENSLPFWNQTKKPVSWSITSTA